MNTDRLMSVSEQWFRLLLRLYPADFRDEMGKSVVDAYTDRAREAMERGGLARLLGVWMAALKDSVRNGPGERLRPAASWRRSGDWGSDMQRVLRRFVRAPLFVLAMVGTLTVGLGAFAVVYTAMDKILLERMPYKDPDDLYFVWRDYRAFQDLGRGWLAGPDVAELAKAGGVIEAAAGMQLAAPTLSVTRDGEPTQITMMLISPGLFELLGVAPALGRGFRPEEAGPARPPVIVLGDPLWKRLGGDPSLVGSQVWLSGTAYTIIGVMPPHFRFVRHSSLGPPQAADLYIPFGFHLAGQPPGNGNTAGIIRARRGTAPETIAAAVADVGRVLDERDHQSRGLRLYPTRLKEDLVGPARPALFALGVAGFFLVLVLTVNLASLLLARAAEREREFAVSRTLGANGFAVARAMIIEGGLLGLLGGITGALAGAWGTRLLVSLAPLDLPRRDTIVLDWNVAVVVISVGVLLGLVAVIVPAAWASRVSLSSIVMTSSMRGAGGPARLRRSMIVAQVALSLVLLSSGGLVLRSFERLLRADPGFNPKGVLTFTLPIGPRLFPQNDAALAFQERVTSGLAELPGVTHVSATSSLPLNAGASQTDIRIPGAPGNTGDRDHDAPIVDYMFTRAGYVETMGMRVLAGRSFETGQIAGVREALIDRQLAQYFFPTGDPLGVKFTFNGKELTVVGVVEQARLYDLYQDGRPQLYLRSEPWAAENFGARTASFVVRAERDLGALIPEVRDVLRRIDPRIPLADVRTMEEIVENTLRQEHISAVLIAGFALGALLLTAMGLFGIISGSVTRRRGEMAIRLALGATHNNILRLLVHDGARLIALGLLLGTPVLYMSGQAIRGILVGVSPFDAVTLLGVGIGFSTIALTTCCIAAMRVMSIEPSDTLKEL
jgi:putative ABC transport system permease protein